jgi:hypothetical protein
VEDVGWKMEEESGKRNQAFFECALILHRYIGNTEYSGEIERERMRL